MVFSLKVKQAEQHCELNGIGWQNQNSKNKAKIKQQYISQ